MGTRSASIKGTPGANGQDGADAPPGGLWNVVDETTEDVAAEVGDLIQVNMAGKSSNDPDGGIIVVQLPLATPSNKGKSIGIAIVNPGGAEDGASVNVQSDGGQTIKPSGVGTVPMGGESRIVLCSTGDAWLTWSQP